MYLRRSLLREEGWRSVNSSISRILPSLAASAPHSADGACANTALPCHKLAQRCHSGPNPHTIGSTCWYSSRSSDGEAPTGGKELHRLYEEQLLEMKEEREMLFGFTESDHSAWTNAGSNHRHDESFLDEINAARHHHENRNGNGDEDTDTGSGGATSHSDAAAMHGDLSVHRSATSHATPMPTDSHMATGRLDVTAREPYAPASNEFFSHVSADGASVRMVDVGGKAATQRVAVAQTRVVFPPEVVEAFEGKEWVGPKGPIFATAKLAGIMAAKRTSELIPLCHPLPLDSVNVDITMAGSSVAVIQCECRVTHKTGVEMEAMTGATIAALTVYDMVKAVSHRVRIEDTVLISKSGGKRTV